MIKTYQLLFYAEILSWHLLGQGRRLQEVVWPVAPVQGAPPCCGRGLVHDRDRDHDPSSHVVLHVPHAVHAVNLPSTARREGEVGGLHRRINACGTMPWPLAFILQRTILLRALAARTPKISFSSKIRFD